MCCGYYRYPLAMMAVVAMAMALRGEPGTLCVIAVVHVQGRASGGAGRTRRTNVVYRIVGRHTLDNNIKRWILIKERGAEVGEVEMSMWGLSFPGRGKTGVLEACLDHILEDNFLIGIGNTLTGDLLPLLVC